MDLPLGLSASAGQSLLEFKQALKFHILDAVPEYTKILNQRIISRADFY